MAEPPAATLRLTGVDSTMPCVSAPTFTETGSVCVAVFDELSTVSTLLPGVSPVGAAVTVTGTAVPNGSAKLAGEAETPAGKPLNEPMTAPLKPFTAVAVTVIVCVEPGTRLSAGVEVVMR